MANPYQHGELKHAAFEALRGASAGLTLEEIAASTSAFVCLRIGRPQC